MSFADQIGKLFAKKKSPAEAESSVAVGLGGPDTLHELPLDSAQDLRQNAGGLVDSLAPETELDNRQVNFSETRLAESEIKDATEGQIELPLLGRGTVARHQRVLFILLGVALLVLAAIAGVALS